MTLKIDINHSIFTLKEKVQEVSSDFLNTFGLNYFQYLRCYDNGAIGLLTNHTGLFEYFQHIKNQPVVFSSLEKENEQAVSYWFLWDQSLPEMPVQLAREQFKLCNGLTLVRRSKNYYDMIAVATPTDTGDSAAFYLNKLKTIEQYINDFDKQHQDLIMVMDNNRLELPEAYRDVNYQNLCLKQGKFPVLGKNERTYITIQELACLRLLCSGMTYKYCAKTLNLSPRTVETYIQRIKQRTGFSSLSELERMLLMSCP